MTDALYVSNVKAARLAKEFPKKCACGNTYETLDYFQRLPFAYRHTDEFATVEYRHCEGKPLCRSTIGVITQIHNLEAE